MGLLRKITFEGSMKRSDYFDEIVVFLTEFLIASILIYDLPKYMIDGKFFGLVGSDDVFWNIVLNVLFFLTFIIALLALIYIVPLTIYGISLVKRRIKDIVGEKYLIGLVFFFIVFMAFLKISIDVGANSGIMNGLLSLALIQAPFILLSFIGSDIFEKKRK